MKSHLILMVDASGSINRRGGSIKSAVVESVNKLVSEQKKIDPNCTVQLFLFNSTVRAGSVVGVGDFRFSHNDYQTKGNTHLYDAVCEVFDRSGQYLSGLPEDQRPAKVIAVLVTDGLERGSQRFSLADARSRILHQTEVYNWQVILLQGNYDAQEEAAKLGVSPDNAIRFTASSGGVEAGMARVSTQTTNYRSGNARSNPQAGAPARIPLANVVASR